MIINNCWNDFFTEEWKKEYFIKLVNDVNSEYDNFRIFPPRGSVFNAFKFSSYTETKVVILGQDPYHGFGQAMGLSFSVPKGVQLPPSLRNIYKELFSDLGIKRTSGCLQDIAEQGVLFLNASLTVREGQPNSHAQLGWQTFTDNVIKHLNEKNEQVIFILWGSFAKAKSCLIANPCHKILTSAHPSPFSATAFFGNRHFSKTNNLLCSAGLSVINWEETS